MQENKKTVKLVILGVGICLAIGAVLFIATLVFALHRVGQERVHQAVKRGDVREVQALLKASPELLEARNRLHLTPLLQAAYYGKLEAAEVLIREGADVNATWDLWGEQEGFNALHVTAIEGHVEVAKLLIKSGTKVNARSMKGATPLDIAIQNGHKELADLFKTNRVVKEDDGR